MPPSPVSLGTFLVGIEDHYRIRGYPESARRELAAFVGSAWVADLQHLDLSKAPHGFDGVWPLDQLDKFYAPEVLDLIGKEPSSSANLANADAIFAFSFGYRVHLAGSTRQPIPGPNNDALARIACDLKKLILKPLAVQFEIGDALGPVGCTDYYPAPRCEMGTGDAIDSFLTDMEKSCGWTLRRRPPKPPVLEEKKTVVVVAHRHHVGRCVLLLNDRGLQSILPPGEYRDYDTEYDSQKRARTPEINICSDFASMCKWMGS